MDYSNQLSNAVGYGLQGMQSGGYAGTLTATQAEPSLSGQLDSCLHRLHEVEVMVRTLGDMVHGPTPTPAGSKGEAPRPIASVASRIRDLSVLISEIENGLKRVGSGL